MLGAIVGDIIGSRFERHPIKTKRFKLFTIESHLTDDTVMTIATLDAIERKLLFDTSYQIWGNKYPNVGYGSAFKIWLSQQVPVPYNSYGNGSAMRVSPIAWIFDNQEDILKKAEQSAYVTHNHPEGIKGAQAIALCIYLARMGWTKEEIKDKISKQFDYNLGRSIQSFKRSYKFDVSCQGSVPEAIIAFLESTDYESAIRIAIALGGDSDTLAAMAGSIAEAYYEYIPRYMIRESFKRIPDEIWYRILNFGIKYKVPSILKYRQGL